MKIILGGRIAHAAAIPGGTARDDVGSRQGADRDASLEMAAGPALARGDLLPFASGMP